MKPMEVIRAYRLPVTFLGEKYDIIMLELHDNYELYAAPADGSYGMENMFALPVADTTPEDAMEAGIASAPGYIAIFRRENWR